MMTPEEREMLQEVHDDLKDLCKYVYENFGNRPTRFELYGAIGLLAALGGLLIRLV
jgi:hypothetical protein